MKYSRLIRSLLEESVGALLGGYPVESVLLSLDSGGDLIRETLTQAVCDLRFKSTVRPAKVWQESAQDKLEEFALELMEVKNLDKDTAARMLEDFLSRYFFYSIQLPKGRPDRLPGSTEENRNFLRAMEDGDGDEDDGDDGDDENDSFFIIKNDFLEPDGDEDDENDEKNGGGNKDEDEYENDITTKGILSREEERRVQTRFMRNIPKSIVRLAKLIGRAGQQGLIPSGSFLTAARPDIAGITVGNDLGNLLPSEIALLSCPRTRDIFYRNFVEKRLQVFASASSASSDSRLHQDGPVIICLDTSGSMEGRPAEIARILTMAVTIVAQRRCRKVIVVKYADSHQLFVVRNLRKQRKALVDFLSLFSGGGNNEEEMFSWLFSKVLPEQAGDFDSADVLCVTDFGWAEVSDDVFKAITENKAKGMVFYGLDITGKGLTKSSLLPVEGLHLPDEIIDSCWLWDGENNRCTEAPPHPKKAR